MMLQLVVQELGGLGVGTITAGSDVETKRELTSDCFSEGLKGSLRAGQLHLSG